MKISKLIFMACMAMGLCIAYTGCGGGGGSTETPPADLPSDTEGGDTGGTTPTSKDFIAKVMAHIAVQRSLPCSWEDELTREYPLVDANITGIATDITTCMPFSKPSQQRGYLNDDAAMENVVALFYDYEGGLGDFSINGFTFTCTERMYDYSCFEGSAMLVPRVDGSAEFYVALSGKIYVYRDDPPEAYTIVAATASGLISAAPDGVSFLVTYDVDSDGANDYDAYYLNADGSIDGPDKEICQSFMIDWTMIRPDMGFGPAGTSVPAVFYDEDGNGLASCDDPACTDHPFCKISYCADYGIANDLNYHGFVEHPSCPACGDGLCDQWEIGDNYCEEDCCGDGICVAQAEVRFDYYCEQDCCGDGVCQSGETLALCSLDCDAACGNHVCEPGEDVNNCEMDCWVCGDGVCTSQGGNEDVLSCSSDCFCGDGKCDFVEQENPAYACPGDCKKL